MRLEDIINAIKLQLSASILPEAKWALTLVYTIAFMLLLLRITIGEPIRNLLFDNAPTLQGTPPARFPRSPGEYYDTEYYVMTNTNATMRMLALVATITMNILPLFLPLFIGSIVNRLNAHQQDNEHVE